MPLGVAHVHAQQVAREDRRLVAAGAGADLEEDVAVVVRILRQQQPLQVGFQRLDAAAGGVDLLLRERLHVRVGQHFLRARELGAGAVVLVEARHHGLDLGPFAPHRAEAVHVARRFLARESAVDLLEPAGELLELAVHGRFHRIVSLRIGRGGGRGCPAGARGASGQRPARPGLAARARAAANDRSWSRTGRAATAGGPVRFPRWPRAARSSGRAGTCWSAPVTGAR